MGRRTEPKLERRIDRRYKIRLALHYRVSQKGLPLRLGSGMTYDLSTGGIGFHCRQPLPVGAHILASVAWPARYEGVYPIDLLIHGLVVRSGSGRAAVRVISRKFRADFAAATPYRVSA